MREYVRVSTKQFRKDLRRLKKSGHNLERLEFVINILSSGTTLPAEYDDHALRGKLSGGRECHIGPDWLLMYAKADKQLILFLIRTGTHRQVLNIE